MGIWDLLDYRPKMKRDDLRYLVGLYREEIAYTDHHVGRLLDGLAAMKHDSDTLVVFLADHGEEFMEHGWISHTKNLYDDVLHVPLTISFPGRLDHRVVDTPVSLLDVGPTLLDLLGLAPGSGDGISLAPLASGGPRAPAERPLFAEVSYGKQKKDADKFFEKLSYKTSLRRGRWKIIHDLVRSRWELYDTGADPSEKKNLVDGKAPRGRELAHELTDWETRRSTTAANPVVQPPPEEIERMRSLGYLR
jgi:arylsulfatase A-like enzyme